MLTVEQENIHTHITLNQTWNTIKSVRANTPGPDGISNLYVMQLWNILAPIILDDWNYSTNTNNISPSHRTELIRLIHTKDKDIAITKKLETITLSICNDKIITRLFNNTILKAFENKIQLF